jgi:Xaa-Pro aminopeptidase
MEAEGLDALVFVASHSDGHRGSVRYVANHRIFAFYGYAVMGRNREPAIVLPSGMRGCRRGGWVEDYRFVPSMIDEVAALLGELGDARRVGIVGLGQIMRIDDFQRLGELTGGAELVDASALFERVRAAKSEEEIRGVEEAIYIADRCHERLLEIARPGLSKRQLGAETLRVCAEHGGEDPIFLTLDNLSPTGPERTRWSQPSNDVVLPGELLQFSFELIGPSGYWVELCRMITFAEPSEEVLAIHAAVVATMDAAEQSLRPGATGPAVQGEMLAAAKRAGTHAAYWLGHGIGQDVLETPMLAMEPAPAGTPEGDPLTATMAFAVHPLLLPDAGGPGGYMADTYAVEAAGTRRLSRHSLDLVRLPA